MGLGGVIVLFKKIADEGSVHQGASQVVNIYLLIMALIGYKQNSLLHLWEHVQCMTTDSWCNGLLR